MEDVYIGERKLYRPEPTLCANDGPIAKLRRWYLQFYTDRAKLAKPLHNHNHEWTVHDLRDRQSEVIAAQEAEPVRSEEHTSALQSLMRISYAVICLTNKHQSQKTNT